MKANHWRKEGLPELKKGSKIQTEVEVLKVKAGAPTVIKVLDREYSLLPLNKR